MPAGFERCVANGGRVRTIKPNAGTYIKICYLNGKSYRGEVHHNKDSSASKNRAAVSRLAKKRRK